MIFNPTILCLFPNVFPGILGESVVGRALKKGIWSYKVVDIKDYGILPHKKVDAKQYGGGEGMVIRADVLERCIEDNMPCNNAPIYYFSPKGRKINNDVIKELIDIKKFILICGKFEGIDDRVVQEYNMKQISIGDFIVSSGEVCAFALLDACVRMIPGVLNKEKSFINESFSFVEGLEGILEYPIYTKPNCR